tara:strand:- start:3165 stop:4454 length:1290 start_codon:yes stop_codon:yes gene_type:complete
MASEDIYNSKKKYEAFVKNYKQFGVKPEKREKNFRAKYVCKNLKNMKYFEKVFLYFDMKDLSYIRRLRLLGDMRLTLHVADKDLSNINSRDDRGEIDKIIGFMHTVYIRSHSKMEFIKNIKVIWKILFPEKDRSGRVDERTTPYCVRHLSRKIDRSKEVRRSEKLSSKEFESLVQYFAGNALMQFYITFCYESLIRPQEACYIKIQDVELHDNYAKIYLSSHGKEGINGFLRCIDSYPYLMKWLDQHPFRDDPNKYLLIVMHGRNKGGQQKPRNFRNSLHFACHNLKLRKRITPYSLKRNGVTAKRLAGYTDLEIQHIARWTSTKQLQTYDLSDAEDTFNKDLVRKGIVKDIENNSSKLPEVRMCTFCKKHNPFSAVACGNCQRPLDRKKILDRESRQHEEMINLKNQISHLRGLVVQIAGKELKSGLR